MKIEALLLHGALLIAPAALSGTANATSLLVVAVWVGATAMESPEAPTDGELPVQERLRAVGLLMMLWLTTMVAIPLHPLIAAGICLVAVGSYLRIEAIRTLGVGFGAGLFPTVPIRDDGPYRYFRHPSELGLLLMTLGVVVMSGSPIAIAGWVPLVLLPCLLRIRAENTALAV